MSDINGPDLREIRHATGVSLRAVARESGIHVARLSLWETGLTRPRPAGVERYMEAVERIVARHAAQKGEIR